MQLASRILFNKSIRMGLLVAGIVGLVMGAMAWLQSRSERRIDLDDQDRRAQVLAHRLSDGVTEALAKPDPEVAKELGAQVEGHRRLIGFAVFRADGRMVASGKAVPDFADQIQPVVKRTLEGKPEVIVTARARDASIHILASRLMDKKGALLGALVVVHDISHLDERTTARLVQFAFWIVLGSLFLMVLVVGATWAAYERPLHNLAEWMQRLRTGGAGESPPLDLPVAMLASESERLAHSFRAMRSSSVAESRSAVHEHNVWSRDRLRIHAMDCLRGGQLIVTSNREPYMHQLHDGKPRLIIPAGGLVTALDPILQSCGGVWVAHGAGDADRETADADGRLHVPPSDPRYVLRRVWLTREEEQGYYYGLSNEGIWPLCHLAHERPIFRAADWEYYIQVNRRFADAILQEVTSNETMILVQDYHLALVPEILKRERPNLRIGVFWHIPWPNPEAFRICPWREAVLKGMLGADLIGFHLQQYCNNFLDTVDRMIEARLDWDHFAVELQGHRTSIRQFPISVESWSERGVPTGGALADQMAALREQYKIGDAQVIVGVDRIDYTKGLAERLRAIARFFEKYPHFLGKYTFVQLGAPSRTHLRRYRDLIAHLESLADEINWKHQTETWKPILFLTAHHDAQTVHAFMHMAPVCIVSSLHDGMNLVAKEYVAAKTEGDGVLILSEFAGAARELSDALVINPYDIEQFAEAIRYAVEMDEKERRKRMARMQQVIEERNIYRWAAKFMTELAGTRPDERNWAHSKNNELLRASLIR
jgi:alpha,alpha-trehalose-phosphate synthase [UDP-forming]